MSKDMPPEALPTMTTAYAQQGKRVIGYRVFRPGEPGGYKDNARLDVVWEPFRIELADLPYVTDEGVPGPWNA